MRWPRSSRLGAIRRAASSVGDRIFLGEGHKQYAAAPASDVVKLPDSIPTEQAAMLNLLGVGHIALRTGEPAARVLRTVACTVGLGVIGRSRPYAWCPGLRVPAPWASTWTADAWSIARAMGANAVASPVGRRVPVHDRRSVSIGEARRYGDRGRDDQECASGPAWTSYGATESVVVDRHCTSSRP